MMGKMVKKLFFLFFGIIVSQMTFAQQPMFCNGVWSTNCNQQQQGIVNPQPNGQMSFQCRPGFRPIPMQNGFQCVPIQQQAPMQIGQQRPVCTQGLRPIPMRNGGYQCIPVVQQQMQYRRHHRGDNGPIMHLM